MIFGDVGIILAVLGIILAVLGIYVTILLSPEKPKTQLRRWFSRRFSIVRWLWWRPVAIWRILAKQAETIVSYSRKRIELGIFRLRGKKMQANLESLIQQTLDDENLSRAEKAVLIAISLHGDGSDNQGLSVAIRSNPETVKQCFQQAKVANSYGYDLLCGRLAIRIDLEAEKDKKEKGSGQKRDYTSYKIPWEGCLEPFFKNVMDS